MTTEPTPGAGNAAVGRHHRPSAYQPVRVGTERTVIAVATVLAAGSVGLLLAGAWGASGHNLLPSGGNTFARDLTVPPPFSPSTLVSSSGSPTPFPAPSPSATAVPVPSTAPARAGTVAPSPKPSMAPPSPTVRSVLSYEAEARDNVRSSGTLLRRVSRASGGYVVSGIGQGQTLWFVFDAPSAGRYALTIYYVAGDRRGATMRVNDGRTVGGVLPTTGDWTTVGSVTVPVDLVSGGNTIEFGNPRRPAPDIDRIVLR